MILAGLTPARQKQLVPELVGLVVERCTRGEAESTRQKEGEREGRRVGDRERQRETERDRETCMRN